MTHFIGGRFRLREKIGSGSFGEIHKGDDVKTSTPVAIKIEQLTCQAPQLENESNAYVNLSGGVNIPRHYFFAVEQAYKAMVIDLEGCSIEDKFKNSGGRFSLKTVLMLIDQMLCSIEFIHKKGYIHRDVKPDNFMFGMKKNENQLYLIDFGLAKKYKNIDGSHIPFKEHTPLTGTARYASINSLSGVEQSRRDDMESLAYIFIYLLKGSLPWMGVQTGNLQAKYDKICSIKKTTQPEDLCAGIPSEFAQFLTMVKKLKFEEQPEYSKYKQMFRDLLLKSGFSYDYKYDWVKYEPKVRNIARQPLSKISKSSKQPIKFHKSNSLKGKDESHPIQSNNLNSSPNIVISSSFNDKNDNSSASNGSLPNESSQRTNLKNDNRAGKPKITSSALNLSPRRYVPNKKESGNIAPQNNQQKSPVPLPLPSQAPAAVKMHSSPIYNSSAGNVQSPTCRNKSNEKRSNTGISLVNSNKNGNRAGSVKVIHSGPTNPAKINLTNNSSNRVGSISSASKNNSHAAVSQASAPTSPKKTNLKMQKR